MPIWSISDTPGSADLAALTDGVTSYGRSLAIGGNPRPIACFVHEREDLVAGCSGRTEFHRLFVHYLWVAEELRSRGLGSDVLKRFEAAAHERGCKDALIETLSDRTSQLYIRLGYVHVAKIPNYVGLFTKHILVKTLSDHLCSSGA